MKIMNPLYATDDAPGAAEKGEFDADMAVLNAESEVGSGTEDEGAEEASERGEEDGEVDQEDVEDEESRRSVRESAEDEEEDDDEQEEDEELKEEVGFKGTSIGAVKKEFPGIFKKFPALKAAFFRDGEFSKIFPNPEDAQIASQKAENYDLLESSLVKGSPELLMKELSENNPKAFSSVVQNWLPNLRALDNKLYVAATEPVIEEVIYLAFKHAERVGDKNLAMSARHLANFVFANGGDIPDISARGKTEPNPAELQLQEERKNWAETRYREADGEIFNHVIKSLDQTIRQGLDPSGTMTERMKSSIVKDVINEINSALVKDPVHGKRMSGLWKRAATDSYSRQSKESIITTYLSGARPLVREIRNRIRSEYLASPKKKIGGKDEKLAQQPAKKRPFEGSSRRVDQRRERALVLDPKKIDYSKTSDMDILSDRITPRK